MTTTPRGPRTPWRALAEDLVCWLCLAALAGLLWLAVDSIPILAD